MGLHQSLAPDLKVSVVVPTRNRGAVVSQVVESLLANSWRDFEVIVVDQSTDASTRDAIQGYLDAARLQYVPSPTIGASTARNIGWRCGRGDVVLFTDDDCIVPSDWIERMVAEFSADESVGLVFCSVVPVEHDADRGTVPHHRYRRRRTVRTMLAYAPSIGMAAGLGARRRCLEELDGFDEELGPGSRFASAEDHDLALRAIQRGWHVVESPFAQVIHDGFRTFQEFRVLTQRDWIGLGAAHAKHLKCGHYSVVLVVVYNVLVRAFVQPILQPLMGRRPSGFKRNLYYFRGLRFAWTQSAVAASPDLNA